MIPGLQQQSTSEIDSALHASVLERQAVIEKKMAEDDAKRREEHYEKVAALGGPELTKEKLAKILKSDKRQYYTTPSLNDKLYLHFGGYKEIKNLEPFTGLKALYLESNALEDCKGTASSHFWF